MPLLSERDRDYLIQRFEQDLIVQVANRQVECVRATDTVCRQGGDEFVILLDEIGQPQDEAHVA
jgi:GGDEF domain-containing protein